MSGPPPDLTGRVPGGLLYMHYRHALSHESHTLRIHLAWFDPTGHETDGDCPYIAGGPVVPVESTIHDTFNAFANLWKEFYSANWVLHAHSVWGYLDGDELVMVPNLAWGDVNGVAVVDEDTTAPLDRKYRLVGQSGASRSFVLKQVPSIQLRPTPFYVAYNAGGVDSRDRDLIAYLSGKSSGGMVMPDGTYCFDNTTMSVWWARYLWDTGVGGGDLFTEDCLIFPRGGKVCNPADGHMTIETPTATFDFDEFGITFPGGHRLEVV